MSRKGADPAVPGERAEGVSRLTLPSPAKINLFLRVVGKRADGYHELVTLMCRVSLADAVSIEFGSRGITVRCDHAGVPGDEGNLAHRAATLFFGALASKPDPGSRRGAGEGAAIVIEKKIPVAAGLGGGSSNAAAVLDGLNQHYGRPLDAEELNHLARALGADVPFFLFKRAALATGIGDRLRPYDGLGPLPVLLVCPDFSVSTPTVYKNLNLRLTKCEKKLKNFPFEMPVFDAGKHLCNDLETVTIARHPEVAEIKRKLRALGAVGALMSGSGPAVFGLFEDRLRLQRALEEIGKDSGWRLYPTELLP